MRGCIMIISLWPGSSGCIFTQFAHLYTPYT